MWVAADSSPRSTTWRERQLRGNLPQAFVHALLIETAGALTRCLEPRRTDGDLRHRSVLHDPDRSAGSRRHLCMGLDDRGGGGGEQGGGVAGLGWSYTSGAGAARGSSRRSCEPSPCVGAGVLRRSGLARGHGEGLPEPGTPRCGRLGHLGRRHRPVGLQGQARRGGAGGPHRQHHRGRRPVRERRLHHLRRRHRPGPARAVGPGRSRAIPGSRSRSARVVGTSRRERDLERVAFARRVIGDQVELFTDANGAYSRKQAVRVGRRQWSTGPHRSPGSKNRSRPTTSKACGRSRTSCAWTSPPANTATTRSISPACSGRERSTASRSTSPAAEGSRPGSGSAGLAGPRRASRSQRTVPPICMRTYGTAVPHLRHVEYFHDHQRVDALLFDGAARSPPGRLAPHLDSPGHGMTLKESDAAIYRR